MNPCEEELSRLLATDVDRYFGSLVTTFECRLYNYSLIKLGNRQDAEEIVQDAFVDAYKVLKHSYTLSQIQTLKLSPWLFRITHNLCCNHHRHRNRKNALEFIRLDTPTGDELAEGLEDKVCRSPETELEDREERKSLHAQVAKLRPCYRDAVALHYIYGLQYSEIGTILQRPANTVKSHARRGLEELSKMLEDQKEM